MWPLTSRIASTWGCSQTGILCTRWLIWKVSGIKNVSIVMLYSSWKQIGKNAWVFFTVDYSLGLRVQLCVRRIYIFFPDSFYIVQRQTCHTLSLNDFTFAKLFYCGKWCCYTHADGRCVYFQQESTTWRMDMQSSSSSSCCGKETWRVCSRQLLRGASWQTSL